MRDIKFRAWDKVDKKILYCDTMSDYLQGKRQINFIALDYGYSGWYGKDFIFMQYIDIKDKNGIEVFEGDIVNIYDWGIANNDLIGVAEIVWDKEELGFRIHPWLEIEDSYDLIQKCLPRCEIIGNIYENPELLEEK